MIVGGSNHNDMLPVRPSVKRPRAALSCVSCRNRKIKCDKGDFALDEACTPCRTKSRHCEVYNGQPGQQTNERSGLMQNGISSAHPSPDAASHSIHMGEQLEDIKDLLLDIRARLPPQAEEHHPLAALADAMEMQPHRPETPSSNPHASEIDAKSFFRSSTLSADQMDGPICLFSVAQALPMLPSKSTVDSILSAFFAEVAPVDTSIDEEAFQARWYMLSQRIFKLQPDPLINFNEAICLATVFICLASSCIRLSCRHAAMQALRAESCVDPPTQADGFLAYSRWIVAKAHFERAQIAVTQIKGSLNAIPSASMDHIELLLAEALFLVNARFTDDSVYKCLSEAVRMALELRLDKPQPDLPPTVSRRRQRLWWQILLNERYMCYISGRSPSLHDHGRVPPLPLIPSASATERYCALRHSFPVQILTGIENFDESLATTQRLVDALSAWWANVGRMNLQGSSTEIASDLLNINDWQTRLVARQKLQLLMPYKRSLMALCRPYLAQDSPSCPGYNERRKCLKAAQTIVQLLSMIDDGYNLLHPSVREYLPPYMNLSWLPLVAFDGLLTLASAVAEQTTSTERDALIATILQGRQTFVSLVERNVPSAARTLTVIDAVWPFISSPAPVNFAEREQRRRAIFETLHALSRELTQGDAREKASENVNNSDYPLLAFGEQFNYGETFNVSDSWPVDWSSFLNIGYQQ